MQKEEKSHVAVVIAYPSEYQSQGGVDMQLIGGMSRTLAARLCACPHEMPVHTKRLLIRRISTETTEHNEQTKNNNKKTRPRYPFFVSLS